MTVHEHRRRSPRGTSALLSIAVASALVLPAFVATDAAAAASAPTAPVSPAVDRVAGQPGVIWFDEPLPADGDAQRQWEQRALPIGNGALGAVVYGGVASEQLQLNEKSLWTGGPGAQGGYNYGNWTDDRGPEDMKAMQDMIAASPTGGVPPETVADLLGSPKLNFGSYQTYGDLKLDMTGLGEATDYRRQLDINQSLVTTTFTSGGVTYTREYFASAADDVIVMRLTADQPGKIGFSAHVDLPNGRSGVSNTASDGRITTKGTLSNNGMRFESQTQVIAEGGTRSDDGAEVTVANADSATVVFAAATDFAMDYDADYRNGVDPHEPVTATVNEAAASGFDELQARHLADYTGLFDRASLDLGAELPDIPTDELLAQYRSAIDPESARALEALFFQYGRYLLISSSREGSLPANLQGVWNRSNNPPWDADYHVNINLQMNYWPAESTNLSETTAPYFDYVDSMVAPGTVTASEMYGARGWVTGNETNPFGFTGLHEYPQSFWQPDAAAWLAQHYYEHYLFTEDEEFLRDRAYPMMKSIAQFWFDFLVVDPRDGSLVVSPSYSPEQGEFSAGASISQEIVWELLSHTKEASVELGETDAAFLAELDTTLGDLDPGLRIGSWGQLQEWKEDWDTQGNQHRHVSHLFGLFPGNQISPAQTPEFAAAAEVSLNDRGDGGTGWSKAWKINFWARLLDGDRSHKMLSEQLKGSTLDNLWDDHPPFQIDGNFGATSGIAEMLLQSHAGSIDVLPALPSAWADGSYTGLKARGDVEVDASWQSGSIRSLSVTPAASGELKVKSSMFTPGFFGLVDAQGEPVDYTLENNVVTFAGEAGQRYEATAELAVSITAPASATTGDTVEATVEVSAIGSSAVEGGRLDIAVPAETAPGVEGWSATPATVDLPTIPAGESHTETVSLKVGAGNEARQSPVVATVTAGEASVTSTAVIAVKPPTPCPVPGAEGTLLAWDLGEDPLVDASGNGVTPMVDGTAPVSAQGPTGSAQRLDDTGYVRSTDPTALGYLEEATFAGEFTIDSNQNSYRRLFDTQPVGNDSEGILIDLTPSNNVRIITSGVGTTTNVVLPTDTWVDVAVTIATNGTITVYVNGESKATAQIASYKAINSCAERTFHVGANRGGGERQKGFADRVAVFPKALDAAAVRDWQALAFGVAEHCETPVVENDTLLAWDLGENPLTDASGRGLIPAVTGGGAVLAEGPTGAAQALDGSTFASSPVTSLGWLPSATFAAEVKIDAGQDSHRRLFDSQPDSTNWDGIIIDLTPSNTVRVITAGADPVNTNVVVPTGVWVDLAVVISETGEITVYLDGEARTGGTIAGYEAIDGCNERPFRVGADQNGGQLQKGAVDRVAVFPTALTADEIADWQALAFDLETTCPTPDADDLLLAWNLGETPATDASGRDLTPTVTGGGGSTAEGPTGAALVLDGDTYVSSPVTSLGYLPSASFATEVTIASGQDSHRRLFDFQPEATNWDGIVVDLTPSNTVRIITAGAEPVNTGVVVPTDAWVDLVVVIAASGDITVYVDDVAHSGGTIPGYTAIDGCNERPIRFAADQGGGQRQKGAVDRVAIFPTALTAEQAADWQTLAFGEEPEPVLPTVASLQPAAGTVDGGTVVTVTGTGLTGSTGVAFGDATGTALEVVSDTELRVTSPAHAAAPVDLVVQHPNGASAPTVFTYEDNPVEPVTPPVVESLTPDHGPAAGGTVVTVTGSGFEGATGATFGGTPGTGFTVSSDTQLSVVTPAHAAGVVELVVTHPDGSSAPVAFTFDETPVVVPGQPTEPGSPAAESELTNETKGGITSPASAPAGSEIVIGVGADRVGQWVSVWLHSDPVHLGWHQVDANGKIRATLPLDVLGAHRLVVLDSEGAVIGWNPILITDGTTTGARPGSAAEIGQIARTGLPLYAGVCAGLLVLAAGLALLIVRRRRPAVSPTSVGGTAVGGVHED
jgi:hypothetical protein